MAFRANEWYAAANNTRPAYHAARVVADFASFLCAQGEFRLAKLAADAYPQLAPLLFGKVQIQARGLAMEALTFLRDAGIIDPSTDVNALREALTDG